MENKDVTMAAQKSCSWNQGPGFMLQHLLLSRHMTVIELLYLSDSTKWACFLGLLTVEIQTPGCEGLESSGGALVSQVFSKFL